MKPFTDTCNLWFYIYQGIKKTIENRIVAPKRASVDNLPYRMTLFKKALAKLDDETDVLGQKIEIYNEKIDQLNEELKDNHKLKTEIT